MVERLSPYDEGVLHELRAWKNPPRTLPGRAWDRAERAVDAVMRRVPTRVVEKVIAWVAPRLGSLTWRATSRNLVLRAYAREGHPIASAAHIAALDLAVVDAVAGDKRLREGAVAGAEGGAAGFFGGFLLAADVAGVMLLSLRAVQSRALVYGFDPAEPQEIAFALRVLDAASRLGPQSKANARTAVSSAGQRLASNTVSASALDWALDRLPRQLATRVTALKSESVAPVLGAFTSAGFNTWYLRAVTETARMAYRERSLRRTYGDDLLTAYGL